MTWIENIGVKSIFEYEGNTYEVYWQMDSDWNWTILGIHVQNGLVLDKSSITFDKMENNPASQTLTATARGISGNITWSIADSSVATISSTTGNTITVTPVTDGNTSITVICGDYSVECRVSVGYSSFNINNSYVFYYVDGMTWREWCDSGMLGSDEFYYGEFRTPNGKLRNGVFGSMDNQGVLTDSNGFVDPDDEIISGGDYGTTIW